jgi:iron complex outermembrane receptor protein
MSTSTIILWLPPAVSAQALEEIIVTARKKEENLQEVPISITAFSSEQLQTRGITNNYEVASFTPNFNTVKLVGRDNDRPTIRGMANPGSRGEANASYFIDGMFVSRSISTANLASMERVEVLRGPQSAQFGRATFSGAVNYVTRKPTNDFVGEINARAGTSDDYQLNGWISGPIVRDRLLFLLSGAWDNYGGQWNNNLEPNTAFTNPPPDPYGDQSSEGDQSPLGEEETRDFLAKLTWLPAESSEINLKFSYTEGDDGHWPNNVFTFQNCYLPVEPNNPEPPEDILNPTNDPGVPWARTSQGTFCGEFDIAGTTNRKNIPDFLNGLRVDTPFVGELTEEEKFAVPVKPGQRRETTRFFAEWIQDIFGFTSTLKGAYTDDNFDSAYDLDHQEVRAIWGLFNFNNQFFTEDYSLEWAVESPADKPLRGKLGVYYYKEEITDRQRSIAGPLTAFGTSPGALFQDPRIQEIENSSIFGSLSYDLADRWTLDIEARYATDDLNVTSGQRSGDSATFNQSRPVTDSLSYSNFTPRFTLSWQATDDLMAYMQFANGNKPGGFNTEYYRSDIFAEYTEYLRDCDPSDAEPPPLTSPPLDPEPECTEEEKSRLAYKEEEQWTYEAGIRSTWLDNRILANLSVFYIDWTNQGLFARALLPNSSGSTNTSTILVNAGESRIVGLELESNFAVTDNLFVFANYGYNEGEFKKGTDPDFALITGGDGDLAGQKIPNSPNHSLIFGFDASAQLSSSFEGFFRSDFLYESASYIQSYNFSELGDRKVLNVRAGIRAENWTLTFYARNLTDDDTPLSVFNFVNFAADPIETPPYPADDPDKPGQEAENNGEFPNMYALNPQPGRDFGIEFQYRF